MTVYFILAFLCLLLVLIQFIRPRNRRHLRNISSSKRVLEKLNGFEGDFKEARSLMYLRKINPFVFEELLLSAFELKGFKVARNKKYTHDGGMDGKIFLEDGSFFLVQAKRYKGYVSKKHLEEFAAKVAGSSAAGGYFIHTGRTGVGNFSSFKDGHVQIISGSKLLELIKYSISRQKEVRELGNRSFLVANKSTKKSGRCPGFSAVADGKSINY